VTTDVLRIGLIDTSHADQPGSMREYADTLEAALTTHADELIVERHALCRRSQGGRWGRRFAALDLLRRARQLRRHPVDVWHHLDGSRAYLGLAMGDSAQVITAHDIIPWLQAHNVFAGSPPVGRAARWLWRGNSAALRRAAVVACDSQATLGDIEQWLRVRPERCRIVPLPLRHSLAGKADEVKGALPGTERIVSGKVLHVGSNAFYKNRAQVLRIFSSIDPRVARELVMIGPAPCSELRALADSLQLGDRLRWVDDCSDEVVVEHYRSAALLLFPSLYEGYGWPVLEAMAFGVPVLAAATGSLPELIDDVTPALPLEPLATWVAHAERLLTSPAASQEVRLAGWKRAREFSAQRMATQMRDVYREARQRVNSKDPFS